MPYLKTFEDNYIFYAFHDTFSKLCYIISWREIISDITFNIMDTYVQNKLIYFKLGLYFTRKIIFHKYVLFQSLETKCSELFYAKTFSLSFYSVEVEISKSHKSISVENSAVIYIQLYKRLSFWHFLRLFSSFFWNTSRRNLKAHRKQLELLSLFCINAYKWLKLVYPNMPPCAQYLILSSLYFSLFYRFWTYQYWRFISSFGFIHETRGKWGCIQGIFRFVTP